MWLTRVSYPTWIWSAASATWPPAAVCWSFWPGKKFNYNVGPAITLPIFDGGRLRAELGEASAGYDIAVARYNQTLVNALKGISDQLIRRESMDKQQHFAAQSVASAQKPMTSPMIAYQRGLD